MKRLFVLVKEEIQTRGIKYIIVGIWNTIFGIVSYTFLLVCFPKVHYLLSGIFSGILAITNAFLCYKFFVFKTKGNFLLEYFRCYIVYGSGMLISMCGMYILVSILGMRAVWANLIMTAIIIVGSYFGHLFFSFKRK